MSTVTGLMSMFPDELLRLCVRLIRGLLPPRGVTGSRGATGDVERGRVS